MMRGLDRKRVRIDVHLLVRLRKVVEFLFTRESPIPQKKKGKNEKDKVHHPSEKKKKTSEKKTTESGKGRF